MRRVGRFGPLRERQFRLLWFARTGSSVGDSLIPVALIWAVSRDLGGGATEVGLVLACYTFGGADDQSPGRGAAEVVEGDERADHDVHADSEVAHGVAEEAGGEPAVAPHLPPALREVAHEALCRRPGVGADVHRHDEERAEKEAPRVDREHPAGAGDGDDRSREGRAEDVRRAARHRDQRVRLLQ